MSIDAAAVQHVAVLARLALPEGMAATMAADLSTILAHMEVLSTVDTDDIQEVIGVGARGLPVREDIGQPTAMDRPLQSIAPEMRDGLILVPRLASHATGGA